MSYSASSETVGGGGRTKNSNAAQTGSDVWVWTCSVTAPRTGLTVGEPSTSRVTPAGWWWCNQAPDLTSASERTISISPTTWDNRDGIQSCPAWLGEPREEVGEDDYGEVELLSEVKREWKRDARCVPKRIVVERMYRWVSSGVNKRGAMDLL